VDGERMIREEDDVLIEDMFRAFDVRPAEVRSL